MKKRILIFCAACTVFLLTLAGCGTDSASSAVSETASKMESAAGSTASNMESEAASAMDSTTKPSPTPKDDSPSVASDMESEVSKMENEASSAQG